MKLERHLKRHRRWSLRTFGPGARIGGLTKHIEKEIAEVRAAPADLDEWLDIVTLALDGAWRAGFTPAEICRGLERLQNRNMARQWPSAVCDDQPTEHIRSGA